LRILWLSWRDIRNPEAGGAEVFTYEVTRRLVSRGHKVTLFAANFEDAKESEEFEGLLVARGGGRYSAYGKAKDFCLSNEPRFDVIIDEMNTKPFLIPTFVKNTPIVGLVHQVPRKGLFYELPFPINYITYHYLVKRWFARYRNIPTITVSQSQQEILREFGFQKTFIVPEGLSVTPLNEPPLKEQIPTFVFVGRLKGYKLPHHAVKAFALIKRDLPNAKMFVIGDGYMRKKLEKMAHSDVTFLGRVDHEKKLEIVKKSHIILVPSVEEGWGLVVTEANAMATPAVAYNVAGLRDSVRHNITGLLTDENTPESMASAAVRLIRNQDYLATISKNALTYSRTFSWDTTADSIESIIEMTVSVPHVTS
jgi:glycosyltransferase involved in cell wall biosynthesis